MLPQNSDSEGSRATNLAVASVGGNINITTSAANSEKVTDINKSLVLIDFLKALCFIILVAWITGMLLVDLFKERLVMGTLTQLGQMPMPTFLP